MSKSSWNTEPPKKGNQALNYCPSAVCHEDQHTHSFSPSATAHKSHWEGSLSYSCQQRDASTSRCFSWSSHFAGKTLESRLWEFSLQCKAAELYPRLETFSLGLCWLPKVRLCSPLGSWLYHSQEHMVSAGICADNIALGFSECPPAWKAFQEGGGCIPRDDNWSCCEKH